MGQGKPRARSTTWWFGLLELAFVVGAILLLVLWISVPDVSLLVRRNPATTAFIDLRRTQNPSPKWRLRWRWQPLKSISRKLRAAVVYAEDGRFYTHDGVDWEAIKHAAEVNLEGERNPIGGSTLTQQLAKNLYLSPKRSYVRKAREFLIAADLERQLSKDRILELYLNIAEWGDGIFGAEAAARAWFGVGAGELSAAQAARLAVALPNPFKRSPKAKSPRLAHKAARLVRRMFADGIITAQERDASLAALGFSSGLPSVEPGEDADEGAPSKAPHDVPHDVTQPVSTPDEAPPPDANQTP